MPLDESLRNAENYRGFLVARRRLLAEDMTALLDSFRPAWLDRTERMPPDDIAGLAVDFTLYESSWEDGHLLVDVRTPDTKWTATINVNALQLALEEAGSGIESDLAAGDELVAVKSVPTPSPSHSVRRYLPQRGTVSSAIDSPSVVRSKRG